MTNIQIHNNRHIIFCKQICYRRILVYTKGFLSTATNLTDMEVEMMPLSAIVLTVELATRFLKDYLDGDLYFRTAHPTHNLERARGQIMLATDMIRKLEDMKRIVSQIRSK